MTLEPQYTKPHIVILGAGASIAALPNGDKKGRKLSVMDRFFENLGYDLNLNSHLGLNRSRNLEEIYLAADQELRSEIEYIIEEHFRKLTIPDEPTLYDQLILGLRPKDLIATFNWDPLLVQAYVRIQDEFNLPQIVFLHGNVAVYYCPMHYNKIGFQRGLCPDCITRLVRPDLLYPIDKKDYNQTPFLSHQWQIFQAHLRKASMVTIFGYSAPTTDVAARKLMKEAWGTPQQRSLEEIEFIDLKPIEILKQEWQEFIHSHHCRNHISFNYSFIATFPRRTIEAYNSEILLGEILDYNPPPQFSTLLVLWEYIRPLQEEEKRTLDE